ncbi:MAG: VOC family protein [Chloroflexota bacterium]
MQVKPKMMPCLWFDGQAEEAAKFYVSVFDNSRIESVSDLIVTFVLDGQPIMALNGGSEFRFTEAISLYVNCDSQAEVDYLWETLSAGGEESQCGWLKDQYGLSWQIVPTALGELMSGDDPARSQAGPGCTIANGQTRYRPTTSGI